MKDVTKGSGVVLQFRKRQEKPSKELPAEFEITKCDFLLAYAALKSGNLDTKFLVAEEFEDELNDLLNTVVSVSAESFKRIEGLNLLAGLEYSRDCTGMDK